MSVAASTSLRRVKKELQKCLDYAKKCGWLISEIDESSQTFTVRMKSQIDQEEYILEVRYDDYPELPLLLEFIDPETGEPGTEHAYPKCSDTFFHTMPCICNPFSRKSYKAFLPNAPHQDWSLVGWQTNPQVGALKSVDSILRTIYSRISRKDLYNGRMA